MTNSTDVEPVSYIYIIKPTGCQNNPGRVFPLDASASIPVLVIRYLYVSSSTNIVDILLKLGYIHEK